MLVSMRSFTIFLRYSVIFIRAWHVKSSTVIHNPAI